MHQHKSQWLIYVPETIHVVSIFEYESEYIYEECILLFLEAVLPSYTTVWW